MSFIEIAHVTKDFGRGRAVDDLSFAIGAGTVAGFLGPNGSGKTTTLRTLVGLVAPTAGTATIAGRPYRQLRQPLREVGALLEASRPIRPARRATTCASWPPKPACRPAGSTSCSAWSASPRRRTGARAASPSA
jgi:ABC-2 type transport system ATP-binding protein